MTDTENIHLLQDELNSLEATTDLRRNIVVLNELAWLISDNELNRANALSETAYALAESLGDDEPDGRSGKAYSLRTQGYINMRLGNYTLALKQLFRARAMFEDLGLDDGLADTGDHIGGVYYQIGDYPEVLKWVYLHLEAAERIGDKRRIANANNNLVNIQFETGDYESAVAGLQHNLQYALENHDKRIEFLSYANLAETYLLVGLYEPSLENAQQAQRVSEEAGFELFGVYAFDLIGKSYLKLGNGVRAIENLTKALALSRKIGSKVTDSLILLNTAQAYYDLGQFDLALGYLQSCISLAQEIDAKSELYKAHLLLSEVYEQQGEVAQALSHFKEHHAIKERVLGDKALQRLEVLQVAHNTETAKKEAEIARLKMVELQQTVTEQTQVRLHLQRQLEFLRALAEFKEKLSASPEGLRDGRDILAEALQHLFKPSPAKTIAVHQNFMDPELGLCGWLFTAAPHPAFAIAIKPDPTILAEFRQLLACRTPAAAARSDDFIAYVIPWSIIPAEVTDQLTAGIWAGGPITELYAAPEYQDFLLQRYKISSLLIFPIHIDGRWWGTLSMTEWGDGSAWRGENTAVPQREDEILLLETAAQMVAGALQRWQSEQKAQRQLVFARALSACTQTLLRPAESEADIHHLLVEALGKFLEPVGVSRVYLYENVTDPVYGPCFRLIADAPAPGIPSLQEDVYERAVLVPWSVAPPETRRQMAAGQPIGGLVKDLEAADNTYKEYLQRQGQVLALQTHPIHIGDFWWGFIGFDDHFTERVWNEDEILLLGTVSEIVKSTLIRWGAESQLRQLNQHLEQQVQERTAELTQNIRLLNREINERTRAEAEIQRMVEMLEQRVTDRSRELAALYDMTILFTEAQDLTDTLEPALRSICQNVDGHGITVHILSADKCHLQLAAHLYLQDWEQIQQVVLTADFAVWLEQADAPLMVTGSGVQTLLPRELLLPAYPTYFSIALRVRREVIGILGVYREGQLPFNIQNVSLLITMAEQLGIIIQNYRLQDQSRSIARAIERQQLARELHDSVAQRIYSLHLFARAGQDALADGDLEDARLRLSQVESNALYTLREMRLLLYQLRPLALENQTLPMAFENRFDMVERRLGIRATVEVDASPAWSENVAEDLFYIITEALNNALKHAAATEVKLTFAQANGRSQITVQDNGRGFDPAQKAWGLGLENMCFRTEKIQGKVTLETAVGQGTLVRITC